MHRRVAVPFMLALWLVPASARGQSLCRELHGLEPGQSVRENVLSAQLQVGVGWNRAPAGWLNSQGGGPVTELAVNVDRTAAIRACTEDGDYETEMIPHGLRFGASAAQGYWSDFAVLALNGGYLFTGSSLRFWALAETSVLGVSSDSVGVALGAQLGAGIFEWLALRARPAVIVGGRGSFDDGFNLLMMLSISPAFLREHFSRDD
jgi:hypothetical protein